MSDKDKDGKFSTQYIPTDEIDAYALGGLVVARSGVCVVPNSVFISAAKRSNR